jgi:DNA mismatch repair protein MutS
MTPLMEQYARLKAKHPRELLLFRCGDFYELFFEDAKEASATLGIALTARQKDSKDGAVPMAGVPYHSAEGYIRRLLAAGKRVAVAEQLSDPKDSPGLVERDVVEVITPGTATEWSMLEERAPLHLLALAPGAGPDDVVGLAWLETSTGRFAAHDAPREAMRDELARIEPAEILLPDAAAGDELAPALGGRAATRFGAYAFDRESARRALCEHFGTATLDGMGCEDLGPALGAAGALLRYLGETKKDHLRAVVRLERYRRERTVVLDEATRRALEITETARTGERRGSLLAAVDRTRTPMGARLLREWLTAPLCDPAEIARRADAVEDLLEDPPRRAALGEAFEGIQDLERLAVRVATGRATPRDLGALAASLARIPVLHAALLGAGAALLADLAGEADPLAPLRERIERTIVAGPPLSSKEGGIIREGVSEDLDRLRALSQEGRAWLARFQEEEARRTGIPSLKVGHNSVFGYYIEVTNAHGAKVPPGYARKQTLKNAERYVTPELREHEAQVTTARERACDLERRLFEELREAAGAEAPRLRACARAVAALDALLSFAALAAERAYVRPRVTAGLGLAIRDGRHPVLEQTLTGEPFVPNDIALGEEAPRIAVVTGPNMAGKSTFCRQVALLVLLAQTGSFVPAREAEIGLADRIFARIGAADEIARGLSTFMVEMTETANILHNATARSLVVLDEVGRGTSTFDGVSLAFAITEHLAEAVGARTLFATHYHELTELADVDPRVANLAVEVKEWGEEIVFLRKIKEGAADKSYGLHVARLAGVPRGVIERAAEILAELERIALDGEGRPRLAKRRAAPGAAPKGRGGPREKQLGLFASEEEKLREAILRLDLAGTTPIRALTLLHEWQERLRRAGG